jgi:hypothetical protein
MTLKNDNITLEVSGAKSFKNIFYENNFDVSIIKEVFITSSIVDDFSFLDNMVSLNKLVFLACKGNNWNELIGKETIKILRLHNIKQNSGYIKNIDFISKLKNLEYIYLKMLGIEIFPDVTKLNKLHTILCSNRKLYDYASLEYARELTTFIGWPETDGHRTAAESFLPILKNKNLKAFQYLQFNGEDKKLNEYVKQYCPNILHPIDTIHNGILDNSKTQEIARLFF